MGAAKGPVAAYCYPVSRDSAYVPLLFEGIEDRYRPVYRQDGSLHDAFDDAARGRDVIVHVHWEEFVLRDCRTVAEADAAAADFVQQIGTISDGGVPVVWTVHNEIPHEIPFHEQFLIMRRRLAETADAILVHNAVSIDVLASQVDLDRSKVVRLPHPSYLGRHEDEATLQAGLAEPPEPRIQGFGWIRRQKGYGDTIAALPAEFLRTLGAHVRISGDGPEAPAVIAQNADRADVVWDVRHVPDAEAPRLLRSAACVVLPYDRVLTSGVALLALGAGAMLVAVDIPQLRELLPPESRRFLYPRGDAGAFRRAVGDVFALTAHERRSIIAANLEIARELRPAIVARRLAAIYDELRARRRRALASNPGGPSAGLAVPVV